MNKRHNQLNISTITIQRTAGAGRQNLEAAGLGVEIMPTVN
jgi:hypothetical protein